GLVDPAGRPARLRAKHQHHVRPGDRLPDHAGLRLQPAVQRGHDPRVRAVRDDVLHAHRLPRRARLRRRADARRDPVPRPLRPVLGAPPRRRRGRVAVLALRRRGLDPAVLDPVPAVERDRAMPSFGRNANAVIIGVACVVTAILYGALAPVFGYRIEWAGVTMLIALGAALGIMFFVLHTGGGE